VTPQGVSAKAWPNPFNNSLQLSVISSHVQPARIAVYNIAGAVQFEKTVFLQAADNNIQIDSGVWAAGLYYVLVSSDDGTWSGKVVKE
jgi:hypothetical protein